MNICNKSSVILPKLKQGFKKRLNHNYILQYAQVKLFGVYPAPGKMSHFDT